MANKRIITGKTTGNFILKGVVKVIGRSLDGLGFNVKSLSKSHAVRKMKNLSPTVMCPNVTVSIAEMIMNKNAFAGNTPNIDLSKEISSYIRRSNESATKVIHEIGKGLTQREIAYGKEAEKLLNIR